MDTPSSSRPDNPMNRRVFILLGMFLLFIIPVFAGAVPVAPGHNVTFINTCNQPVWINLQGGPKGECDHDFNKDGGRVNCSACSVCASGDMCNTSKTTGDLTPLCCPGIRKDLLYCWNKENQCVPGGCCPGIPQTHNTAYNCPGANQTTGCQNSTMNQSQIDALSGYNNPANHLSRIVCNGSLISNGGFVLNASNGTRSFVFDPGWQGAFYPRTTCSLVNGNFHCETGNCKDSGNTDVLECGGAGSAAPVTKGEINFDAPVTAPVDYYDVSWVDGFNIAMVIQPTQYDSTYTKSDPAHNCATAGCSVGLNDFSSPEVPDWKVLKYPSAANFAAILSDCNLYSNLLDSGALPRNASTNKTLFGYCCPIAEGFVNDSALDCKDVPKGKTCKTCAGQNNTLFPFNQPAALPNSADLFFNTCPNAYAYTYNDTSALMTCKGNSTRKTAYRITLSCPAPALVPTLTRQPGNVVSSDSSGEEPLTAALISPGGTGSEPLNFIFNDYSRSGGSSAISDTTLHHIHVNTTEMTGETVLRVEKNPGLGEIPGLTGHPFAIYYRIESPHLEPSQIGSALVEFSVKEKTLTTLGLKPEDIVLLYWDGTRWTELPTVYDYGTTGRAYFSATTPSFSYFVITSKAASQVSATGTTLPMTVLPSMDTVIVPASPVARPRDPGTPSVALQVSPAAQKNQSPATPPADPGPGIPVLAAGLIVLGCCTIGGGWYVHRWWVRRQNPALFRNMD
jgi:PGF-pre-PGF domain-containing protein